jgi:hypothetical protein
MADPPTTTSDNPTVAQLFEVLVQNVEYSLMGMPHPMLLGLANNCHGRLECCRDMLHSRGGHALGGNVLASS